MSRAAMGAGRAIAMVMLMTISISAADKKTPDGYDEMFAKYLAAARQQAQAPSADTFSWMNNLMADLRARNVNDLITIRVVESIAASGSADSSLSKSSNATAGVPNLFGLEGKLPSIIDPTSLATTKSDSKFKGAGTTTR